MSTVVAGVLLAAGAGSWFGAPRHWRTSAIGTPAAQLEFGAL